jgi:hypothetical protein
MGYFEISSKRDSDAEPLESRVLIADKDIDRITVAYAHLYFPNGVLVSEAVPGTPEVPAVPPTDAIPAVPPTYDEEGNMIDPGSPEVPATPGTPGVPAVPPQPAVYRPPTGQEVFDAVANGLLQGILANTINQEKATAAKDAQDAVPPIPVEPGA